MVGLSTIKGKVIDGGFVVSNNYGDPNHDVQPSNFSFIFLKNFFAFYSIFLTYISVPFTYRVISLVIICF